MRRRAGARDVDTGAEAESKRRLSVGETSQRAMVTTSETMDAPAATTAGVRVAGVKTRWTDEAFFPWRNTGTSVS